LAHSRDKDDIARLQDRVRNAQIRLTQSDQDLARAKGNWDAERNAHESSLISTLRGKLHRNSSITQVLDPWYMDINTKDNVPPVPNEQRSPNEKIHNNHLHITVLEPKIL
jgi:hypothetical protein